MRSLSLLLLLALSAFNAFAQNVSGTYYASPPYEGALRFSNGRVDMLDKNGKTSWSLVYEVKGDILTIHSHHTSQKIKILSSDRLEIREPNVTTMLYVRR